MGGIESVLKACKFRPLKIAGEIFFGTQGEVWEKKKFEVVE